MISRKATPAEMTCVTVTPGGIKVRVYNTGNTLIRTIWIMIFDGLFFAESPERPEIRSMYLKRMLIQCPI